MPAPTRASRAAPARSLLVWVLSRVLVSPPHPRLRLQLLRSRDACIWVCLLFQVHESIFILTVPSARNYIYLESLCICAARVHERINGPFVLGKFFPTSLFP